MTPWARVEGLVCAPGGHPRRIVGLRDRAPGGAYGLAYFAAWQTLVRPDALRPAVAFAEAVGVFFGWYPAWKASRLDPIEGVRT